MVKAMLSGCVVAAVSTTVNSPTQDLIIPLRTKAFGDLSADEIHTTVDRMEIAVAELKPRVKHLQRAGLASKMLLAYAYARAKLVHQKRLEAVESLLVRWAEGERGYLFPQGINLDCHSGSKGTRPPWCTL